MNQSVILDTGPLVAFLSRTDDFHDWSVDQWKICSAPLFTCESVISEAVFLLEKHSGSPDGIFELIHRKIIQIDFSLQDEFLAIAESIHRYRSIPMSLADACLVRLSEKFSNARIFTLNRDFSIYRRHHRQVIPLICPW